MNGQPDNPANSPSETNKWLVEEYKILQAKIDKLGEDRFKVRSWSVTLVSGLVVGAKLSALNLAPILLFAGVAVALFHLVEHQQRETSRRLGWRAREIERALEKQDSSALRKELRFVPGIADALIRTSVLERRARFPRPWQSRGVKRKTSAGAAIGELNDESIAERALAIWRWCVPRADNLFYVGQYCALGAMLLYSILGGNILKSGGKTPAEPSFALNSTNSFAFSFPATNVVVTNYVATNVTITNFVITNVLVTNVVMVNQAPTNVGAISPKK